MKVKEWHNDWKKNLEKKKKKEKEKRKREGNPFTKASLVKMSHSRTWKHYIEDSIKVLSYQTVNHYIFIGKVFKAWPQIANTTVCKTFVYRHCREVFEEWLFPETNKVAAKNKRKRLVKS